MKIIQLVSSLNYGDAVGNDVVALDHLFKSLGYETKIYTQSISPKVEKGIADIYTNMPVLKSDDIIIYHMATGSEVMKKIIMNQKCKKIMRYHNITPPKFFTKYDTGAAAATAAGLKEVEEMKSLFNCCWAVSEFNKKDLLTMGYKCPIDVLPVIIPLSDYDKKPNEMILDKYGNDGWVNFLFVGRVVPNKKQEDIIRIFAYYKRRINPKCRLFIVGNYDGTKNYYDDLSKYIRILQVNDIIFTGHTPFDYILAYYKLADIFLCMSEHEGFCVPLVEAMKFKVPIVAYNSCAIPSTLGNAGVLVNSKNSVVIAKIIEQILANHSLKDKIIKRQTERLNYFSYDAITKLAVKDLKKVIYNEYDLSTHARPQIVFPDKDLENLIRDIEIQVTDQGLYDQSEPFDKEINSSNSKTILKKDDFNLNFKHVTKKIMKFFYGNIATYSPTLANEIRNTIYKVIHQRTKCVKLRFSENIARKEDRIIIEQNITRNNPSILIDLTITSRFDLGTGIQRVVNNIYANIKCNKIPVRKWNSNLITSNKFECNRKKNFYNGIENYVSPQSGDKLLLLDSSWDFYDDFSYIIDDANKHLCKTYSVIYDMIPVQYPDVVINEIFRNHFISWHKMVLKKCDAVLCISRTTADVVCNYFKHQKIKRPYPLKVYYFHLGFDISEHNGYVRDEIMNFVSQASTFLMVGTVEPRKGYMVALQAFKNLVKSQHPVQLLIIGHNGWNNDDFIQSLDDIVKNNILWIQDGTDDELHWAYQHTQALIAASRDEGFGLPLIEAAHFGLPIICSDIPIFHEVTQGYADYFKVMNSEALAEKILEWINQPNHPDSSKIKLYSWEECAQEIVDITNDKIKPYETII